MVHVTNIHIFALALGVNLSHSGSNGGQRPQRSKVEGRGGGAFPAPGRHLAPEQVSLLSFFAKRGTSQLGQATRPSVGGMMEDGSAQPAGAADVDAGTGIADPQVSRYLQAEAIWEPVRSRSRDGRALRLMTGR